MISASYSNKIPKLTLESVCSAIKVEKILEDIGSITGLLRIANANDIVSFSLLSLWFQVIKESAKRSLE